MATSPSTLNYSVLKGIVKWTPTAGVQRDLGNAPTFQLSPSVTKLDHFTSRAGVKSKDKSVATEKTLALKIVLDEISPENLQLALMGGDISVNTAGNKTFNIFANSEITGAIEFTGTNDIGNQVNLTLPSVTFTPSGNLDFISDEWGQIEIDADVLYVDAISDFGTCEIVEATS